jgi:hypothetical protein
MLNDWGARARVDGLLDLRTVFRNGICCHFAISADLVLGRRIKAETPKLYSGAGLES